MNTMLFSQPVAGMLYEPDGDPDGVPVTIIGLNMLPEPSWHQALVVDADGTFSIVSTHELVFVGLAPLHTNTTEAIDLDPRNRP